MTTSDIFPWHDSSRIDTVYAAARPWVFFHRRIAVFKTTLWCTEASEGRVKLKLYGLVIFWHKSYSGLTTECRR